MAKIMGSTLVAVAALIISALAYYDQHQVDAKTNANSIRANADAVSFWLERNNIGTVDPRLASIFRDLDVAV
jgi:hypothetical protein